MIVKSLGKRSGGRANSFHGIWIPEWMLADREQTLSTIRHEYAHNLTIFADEYTIHHGKEFHGFLKQIAGAKWRRDLHWERTPAIIEARRKVGLEKKEENWHTYVCPDGCGFEYKTIKIPNYVKKGSAQCARCGAAPLKEAK
jgi:predicted SprT family Zn-dependent metalloprotease